MEESARSPLMSELTQQAPRFYGWGYMALIPVYACLYEFLPGVQLNYGSNFVTFTDSLYFSVITLTTLGYGDILPANTLTQMLASSETLFGVITIGLFLNSLSIKLSQQSAQAEKERERLAAYYSEVRRLRGFDRLVQLNVDFYLQYTATLTTPFGQRKRGAEALQVNPDFKFNHLRDLFKPTLRLSDNHFKPAVAYYFRAQESLVTSIKELVHGVDLRLWPEMEATCIQFITNCRNYDYSDYILNQPKTQVEDMSGAEFDARLIEQHEGDLRFEIGSPKAPYVGLYKLIKANLKLVETYVDMVHAILDEVPDEVPPVEAAEHSHAASVPWLQRRRRRRGGRGGKAKDDQDPTDK